MNPTPPLSRRETIATSLLAGILSGTDIKRMTVGFLNDAVLTAVNTADELLAGLDRAAPVDPEPVLPEPVTVNALFDLIRDVEESTYQNGRDMVFGLVGGSPVTSVSTLTTAKVELNQISLTNAHIAQVKDNPVSPSAPLPSCPSHIPAPPTDCVYAGRGLRVLAVEDDQARDVFCLDTDLQLKWRSGFTGRGGPGLHYALRRGSPIARANGITD